jgi:myosin heavy subunit
VFKEEEKMFISEGLAQYCSTADFKDNQPVIDLLEASKTGIFGLIDSSCSFGASTDENLL